MPIEMRLWRIEDRHALPIPSSGIGDEARLEEILAADISILGLGPLMLLNRQLRTDHGSRIDLLAIDEEGTLYVIELKRDRTPREVVAQSLDYGSWVNQEAVSREHIRAGIERLQGLLDYFVQTTHPGTIQLDGDTAAGRAYISELVRVRDGRSELNYAVYHDRYQRTPDGWRFTERVYEVRYLDTTPLAGSAPARARSQAA